jgi:hypothetical protein
MLITLQFPMDDARQGGPPYALSSGIYHELLDDHWEQVYEREVTREESRAGPEEADDYRPGRERIALWRRLGDVVDPKGKDGQR